MRRLIMDLVRIVIFVIEYSIPIEVRSRRKSQNDCAEDKWRAAAAT
jgi:hypothetical protein